MKRATTIFLTAALSLFTSGSIFGQPVDEEATKLSKKDFSRFSIGAEGGVSALFGNLSTFNPGKGYVGYQAGIDFKAALSPWFSAVVSFQKGGSKLGAPERLLSHYLGDNRVIYAYKRENAPSYPMNNVYGKTDYLNLGVGVDFNISNLFAYRRFWSIYLTPMVYVQRFNSVLYFKDSNEKIPIRESSDGLSSFNLGVGGDVAFQVRLCRALDLRTKLSMVWINNPDFDGTIDYNRTTGNFGSAVNVGLVYKFGSRKKSGKIENLSYYKPANYVEKIAAVTEVIDSVRKKRTSYRENIVEKEKQIFVLEQQNRALKEQLALHQQTASTTDSLRIALYQLQNRRVLLPSIYFESGSAAVHPDNRNLKTVVEIMKTYPEIKIRIYGYTSSEGSESENDKLSQKRAQNIADYLEQQGVASERMKVVGYGTYYDDETADRYARVVTIEQIR